MRNNAKRNGMPAPGRTAVSNCPDCGTRLSGGACAACALEQLLTGGGSLNGDDDFILEGENESPAMEFGRYALKERIAAGGMGVVYVAEDLKLKRTVALKMIRGATFAKESEIARFTIEAEAAAALDHPHIVPIYEIGRREGLPYFTMKWIEGGNLAEKLRSAGGSLSPSEAALLLRSVARAVHHAHHRGVLHRDLKPGNILIDKAGVPFLTDFGLAKLAHSDSGLTLTSDHLGTPDYMSPELAGGQSGEASTASDVWALGVILWEMLHGTRPFRGPGTVETLRKILEEEPARPRGKSADEDLTTLALRCMEKDPARRPDSAGEVADELERWLRGEPIRARRITRTERFAKWVRRSKLLAALYAVLAVGVALSLVLWFRAEKAVVGLTQTNDQLGIALRISTATKLAVDARLQMREDPARALLLAVESVELTEKHEGGILPEAVEALHEVLQLSGGRDVSPFGPQSNDTNDGYIDRGLVAMLPVEMSPDGRRIATMDYSDDKNHGVVAALFDLRALDRTEPLARWRVWQDFDGLLRWIWLGDSRHLVTVGNGNELRMWDMGDPAQKPADGQTILEPSSRLLGNLSLQGKRPIDLTLGRKPNGRSLFAFAVYTEEGEDHSAEHSYFSLLDIDPARATPIESTPLQSLPSGHGDWVEYKVSPDGNWVVVAYVNEPGPVYLGDLREAGRGISWLELPEGKLSAVFPHFSPGSSRLAMVRDSFMVRIYDLTAGTAEDVTMSGRDFHRCGDEVESLAFSNDDRLLAIGTGGREIIVASVSDAAPPVSVRLGGAAPLALGFSSDGKWLAAGGKDRMASVWPVEELRAAPLPLQFRGLTTPLMAVAFTPGQEALIGSGMHCSYRLWEFGVNRTGSEPRTLPGRSEQINDLALSPDNRWVATACGDLGNSGAKGAMGSVKLADVKGGSEHVLGSHAMKASAVAFSPDGRWLASTGQDGMAKVWDFPGLQRAIEAGKDLPAPRHILDMTDTRLEFDRHLAFHPRGTLYAVCGDGVLFEWDLEDPDPDPKRRFHVLHSIRYLLPDLRISPDGRWLAVCRHGWDSVPQEGFTQIGNMVLLYDVSVPGPPVPWAELPAQFLDTTNVEFSPDGRWLAAGGAGTGATVWDLKAPDIAASRHNCQVSSHILGAIGFSPDGRWLALGGNDGRLHLWDWRNGSQVQTIAITGAIASLDWLDDGRLVTGGESGFVSLWETDIRVLKRMARRVAGRELSPEERERFRIPR